MPPKGHTPLGTTVVTIPLTTIPVGSHDFGPSAISNTISTVEIDIDRTVAGGLNSQPATTQLTLSLFQSPDSGVTWNPLTSGICIGGIIVNRDGTITTNDVGGSLTPGNGREIKGNITVTGSSVAVSGEITIQ